MEILKGQVRDPGYPDCECTYAKMDDGQLYYFIKDGELPNQNVIATKILKEAIGHTPYTSLGLINSNGDILIPFENKAITRIGEDLLLVEKNVPTTQSVVDAIQARSDPFAATNLVNTANTIKEQMKSVMGYSAEFIFDNQFSEAALYNIYGQNIGGAYFSFIGKDDMGNCYMSSNVANSQIVKYDPNLVQNQASQSPAEQSQEIGESIPNVDTAPTDVNESNLEEQVEEESVSESQQIGSPVEENSNTSVDLEIPNIDIPIQSQVSNEEPLDNFSPNPLDNAEQGSSEEVKLDIDTSDNSSVPSEKQNLEMENDSQNTIPDFEGVGEDISGSEDSGEDTEEDVSDSEDSAEDTEEDVPDSEDSEEDTEEDVPDSEDSAEDMEEDVPDSEDSAEDTEEDVSDSEDSAKDTEEDIPDSEDSEEDTEDDDADSNEDGSIDGGMSLEDITNPVILNATNTIRKLLDENRTQRETIDHQADELENVRSSNEILLADNQSKEQELRSLRKSMGSYRNQTSMLNRENNKLKTTNERQQDIINNLKLQNQALKEQVAGISALGSAVAEANTVMGVDDSTFSSSDITYDTDLGYLDDSDEIDDSFQKKKVA